MRRPTPGQDEDRLREQGSGKEGPDLQAQDRDDGNEGVLEGMLQDNRALRNPLGAGRSHVILLHDI